MSIKDMVKQFNRSPFNSDVAADAMAHARSVYPEESCGIVVDNKYMSLRNVAKDKSNNFHISRDIIAKYKNKIEAVIHSHPDGPYYPSAGDMRSQIAMSVPWGIVYVEKGHAYEPFFWGDTLEVAPLKGRPFQHGIFDCYSLIRDYFRAKKDIVLDEFPRDWEWWLDDSYNLYQKNFESQGFECIDAGEVQEGDCFLAQIRSNTINHAGVYVGNGLVLHQIGNREGFSVNHPSCEQPVYMWERYIRHWVRHIA
ncbi:NlpC/P60 family protein [Agarilytica rhodophyticola]|uniref:NlpC/P60 family protein n=1 Tax=Agarilytica rhodophyticola TaxID=1737490 RepID=UPI000B348DCA|nr:NlpC/P60 family protein [Agarilytica rhodophyticola]